MTYIATKNYVINTDESGDDQIRMNKNVIVLLN